MNSDFEAVYTLVASIFASELMDVPSKTFFEDIKQIEKNYRGEGEGFWVAHAVLDEKNGKGTLDGELLGVIGVKQDTKKVAMLKRFFVNPNFRKQGVGGKLLTHVIKFCEKSSYRKIFFSGNNKMIAAKAILEKFNFDKEEEIPLGEGLSVFRLSLDLKQD